MIMESVILSLISSLSTNNGITLTPIYKNKEYCCNCLAESALLLYFSFSSYFCFQTANKLSNLTRSRCVSGSLFIDLQALTEGVLSTTLYPDADTNPEIIQVQ